ncbi:family 2 encapsulin nanocompartment cargo protein terpene cyclase [Kitasatospora cathayae]|uniref:Terpene synthase n=1 Tax=Kitasatospora cathayae TaxID=3004092 RepID=A0ABY7PX76_9ACTN|nr:family 2 encapsulin nanocompartment cargo protein terpene cyclase [Kitasatospora sp. HUAS 3-15]WBP84950.1 family 2 encapsulin nanocompartment cargo protein terpene cyclase [Kitasatospora sp. HUAS 3-15]
MSSPAIERILRGPTGLGTAGLQLRPQIPAPETPGPNVPAPALQAPEAPAPAVASPEVSAAEAVVTETSVVEVVALEALTAKAATFEAAVPDVRLPSLPGPSLPIPSLAIPSFPGPAAVAPAAAAAPSGGKPKLGDPIPGLYHHPIAEPDPVRVEALSQRIKAWAIDEIELYPPEWEKDFDGFSTGRYMVACHPDAPSVDHLMLAARLMVAENAVDDCYCEDLGGSPIGLGSRLLLAHTALDPLHTTPEYHPAWEASLSEDAPRRSYRSAMDYFVRASTPSQADRFRHDMARLHMGYLAEAAWAETDHVPEVWEYLAMRQFNNFRPCPTITDAVGGYELPAELHALPAMQRVIALAGNATTIVNDLYSYTKELTGPGLHLNLPVVISEREGVSRKEGYLKAVEVHNDLMHAFEAESAALALACPVPTLVRFLHGVAAWLAGNHYWHQTNTHRYSLPDFW